LRPSLPPSGIPSPHGCPIRVRIPDNELDASSQRRPPWPGHRRKSVPSQAPKVTGTGAACSRYMTAQHIVADLCTKLDRLIHAVSDDPVLRAGLQRERARLHIALESLQGSAANRQQANLSLKPRTAQPAASPQHQPQSPANLRQLRRCRLAVRAACYSALAAELLDGRRFDVLLLLCQRAVNQSHRQLASCSSLSDSGGAASGVVTTGSTGALCTGNLRAQVSMQFLDDTRL
jgi:hypothetical protein